MSHILLYDLTCRRCICLYHRWINSQFTKHMSHTFKSKYRWPISWIIDEYKYTCFYFHIVLKQYAHQFSYTWTILLPLAMCTFVITYYHSFNIRRGVYTREFRSVWFHLMTIFFCVCIINSWKHSAEFQSILKLDL